MINYLRNISDKSRHTILTLIIVVVIIAAIGIGIRILEDIKLRHQTEKQATIRVSVVRPKKGPAMEEIVLPANILAWHETTIYARTNGYVVEWLADIGSRVKAGDLLATISAPEVDAQLRQTEADLKTAQANYGLALVTAKRWKNLLKTESVSKQETDEKVSDAEAKAAIVSSTAANRDRLKDLVKFEKVIAPFDGIISSRNTDIGRLINAGSSGTVPLFQIVQSDILRTYVNIPQNYSANITPRLTADLSFMEHPGKVFKAKLLDNAKAIDATSRTLLVQFIIDNKQHELMPGSYTEVHIKLPANKNSIRLPASALIFQSKGLQIATVNQESKIILKPVVISRDLGDEVEIGSGVSPQDEVILNPPDSLNGGEKVSIISPKPITKKR